jgi:adenosine kinase
MPIFSETELLEMVKNASGLFLNEYEFSLLEKQLCMSSQEIIRMCPLLIITLGEKGSKIYFGEKEISIPALKPKQIKDPTGCGDAYRAGFLKGIEDDFPKLTPKILEQAGQLGTKLATACLETVGTQNHTL